MGERFKLKRQVFEHKAGTVVYPYGGYDYGLSRDDTYHSGVAHRSMTLSSDGLGTPFFTVPVDALEAVTA